MRSVIIGVVLLVLAFPAAGQKASWVASADELGRRRVALMEAMGEGVALIPGARATGSYAMFRQNNRFFYLTGLEVEDAYLILDASRKKAMLLVPKPTRFKETWEGKQHDGIPDLQARTGIRAVNYDTPKLLERLREALKGKKTLWLPRAPAELGMVINDSARPFYSSHGKRSRAIDWVRSREDWLQEQLSTAFPDSKVKDVSPLIRRLRAVKSPFEQGLMRTASDLSAQGMIEVIKTARPGRHEYELGAIMEFTCKMAGAQGHGYAAIVGSGPNSCVLHYNRLSRKLGDGDIVVVDAACSYGYYTADVTRTFPANGKFTPAQAKVYNAVLEAQEAAIKACKPGVSISQLDRIARGVLAEHKLARRFFHGLGHHVGMAVHDPLGPSAVLKPGHIITIEPGAYITERALGVRIEDVILVTETGCEVLSARVPRKLEEVEALMKQSREK